jgi:methylenetetrahydrofolate dehydrogenase (NADP+)/methenyltetrahydrofolate cyclohydrolase
MPSNIIDGTAIATSIRNDLSIAVEAFRNQSGISPALAVVLVGDNPASAIYVRNKERACEQAGIATETFILPDTTSAQELIHLIQKLNANDFFHGILLQLPLPPHVDANAVIAQLDPAKDVDGLHPENMGRLLTGSPYLVPCTPAGIQELLLRSGHSPNGKHVVVCGRSDIVGKPIAALLVQRNDQANATVSICHSQTPDLPHLTKQADILIAAIGKPNIITADMVKDGVVVIDVGINRIPDKTRKSGHRLVGDVDYLNVALKASAITPVPGGVGPMTIAMLLKNTLTAAREQHQGR